MALGGAFFAANSSKKFKVKGINLYDGFNFDIRLVLRNLDETIEELQNKRDALLPEILGEAALKLKRMIERSSPPM